MSWGSPQSGILLLFRLFLSLEPGRLPASSKCMLLASLYAFEIRDVYVYIYAPEILKWLFCKTRGTQYASIHRMYAHANY